MREFYTYNISTPHHSPEYLLPSIVVSLRPLSVGNSLRAHSPGIVTRQSPYELDRSAMYLQPQMLARWQHVGGKRVPKAHSSSWPWLNLYLQ